MRWHLRRSWWRLALCILLLPLLAPFCLVKRLRIRILGVFVRIALLGIDNERFERLLDVFVVDWGRTATHLHSRRHSRIAPAHAGR
jgi:hypothetical protein